MNDAESSVRGLYDRMVSAWNERDAKEMAAEFADDGECVGFDGSELDGRTMIAKEMARIFADHQTGKYVIKVRGVRRVADDAAILRAVAGLIPVGKDRINPETNAIVRMVAVRRDGKWRIAQLTNTAAQFHGRPELAKALTDELQALAK